MLNNDFIFSKRHESEVIARPRNVVPGVATAIASELSRFGHRPSLRAFSYGGIISRRMRIGNPERCIAT